MNLSFITSILVSLLFVDNIEARWKPTQGMTWNYVLGHSVDIKIEKAQVLDVDVNKSVGTIEEYHKAGKKVICYFSGGTLENFRDDKDDFYAVKGLVRNTYEAWADEKWLDIRKADLKPLIKRRMETAVKKNCDAIEVDNLDAYQFDEVKSWDDPLTKKDLINYAIWLGKTAHELGISIGLKNALFMIDEVSNYFDFAINESCAALSHPECHLYKNFLKQGKAVFGITYNGFSRYQSALCKELNGLGISMIVKETGALEQAGTIFDGKKHCKNFDPGYIKPSSDTSDDNKSTKSSNSKDSSKEGSKNDSPDGGDKNKDGNSNNGENNSNSGNNDNNNDQNGAGKIINDVLNSTGGSSKTGKFITGFAVTGSVFGAAGIFVFKKKSPRQYEEMKQSLSRTASSVKRSLSVTRRKNNTKKTRKLRRYLTTDVYYKLEENPYSNYRYNFANSFDFNKGPYNKCNYHFTTTFDDRSFDF